jgi:Uncharacterised nucleotidyltransferase
MRAQLIGNGLLTARVSNDVAAVFEALQLQAPSLDRLLSLNDRRWQQVLCYCDRMQLTLPLALRSSERFPSWVGERLKQNLADTTERFALVQATYREMAAVLARAGIPYVVLKGFAQSPDFVKTPQFRMQGDIDFYVPREKMTLAVRALEAVGYEAAGGVEAYRTADHHPTLVRFGGWRWRGNRFDPEMPLALEVHYCLWNEALSLIPLPEIDDFWNRRIERKLGELSFPGLSVIDHLGYFALHVLRNLFAGDPVLHHTLELATFVHQRADDTAFWTEWQALHSSRLRQIQLVALALAGAAFSSRLPDPVREQIARLPAERRQWIESCGGDLLAGTFSPTRDGRLLQFLLSESPQTRRKIVWKALSPGVIPTPRKVASRSGPPGAPRPREKQLLWRYPAYLASRSFLRSAALLRLVAHGLTIWVSGFTLRRTVRPGRVRRKAHR